jgi:hypothetical protein
MNPDTTGKTDFSSPEEAYEHAMEYGPSDASREKASEHPTYAVFYGIGVDKKPHKVTRDGAKKNPQEAYNYALLVDRRPRKDTRLAVTGSFEWLAMYELNLPDAKTARAVARVARSYIVNEG